MVYIVMTSVTVCTVLPRRCIFHKLFGKRSSSAGTSPRLCNRRARKQSDVSTLAISDRKHQ